MKEIELKSLASCIQVLPITKPIFDFFRWLFRHPDLNRKRRFQNGFTVDSYRLHFSCYLAFAQLKYYYKVLFLY